MYRDFAGAIRGEREPEMSLERAMEDQRLMEQAYATASCDASVGRALSAPQGTPAR
jgi:predicted dehydrogenase